MKGIRSVRWSKYLWVSDLRVHCVDGLVSEVVFVDTGYLGFAWLTK